MQSYRKGNLRGITNCLAIDASVMFNITEEEVLKFLREEIQVIEPEDGKILYRLVTRSKSLEEVQRGMRMVQWVKEELGTLRKVELDDERIIRYVALKFEKLAEMERAMNLLHWMQEEIVEER